MRAWVDRKGYTLVELSADRTAIPEGLPIADSEGRPIERAYRYCVLDGDFRRVVVLESSAYWIDEDRHGVAYCVVGSELVKFDTVYRRSGTIEHRMSPRFSDLRPRPLSPADVDAVEANLERHAREREQSSHRWQQYLRALRRSFRQALPEVGAVRLRLVVLEGETVSYAVTDATGERWRCSDWRYCAKDLYDELHHLAEKTLGDRLVAFDVDADLRHSMLWSPD